MAEGIETPLLGQQLLVGHWVDRMWEAERRAETEEQMIKYLICRLRPVELCTKTKTELPYTMYFLLTLPTEWLS